MGSYELLLEVEPLHIFMCDYTLASFNLNPKHCYGLEQYTITNLKVREKSNSIAINMYHNYREQRTFYRMHDLVLILHSQKLRQ